MLIFKEIAYKLGSNILKVVAMNENYQKIVYTILVAAGVILFILGITVLSPEEYSRISGIFIGVGVGLVAVGFSLLATSISNSKLSEDVKKVKEIETNDERNVMIRERAGYKTCTIMNYVLCIFIVAIGLMGADIEIILMAVALLVIQFILIIYYSNHYSKTI